MPEAEEEPLTEEDSEADFNGENKLTSGLEDEADD